MLLPLSLAWWLLPPLDYLPPVKRAAIDAFFNFPPGMSSEAVNRELLPTILERMRPYMEGRLEPRLKNWYILTWPGGGTIGARVQDETRIGELETYRSREDHRRLAGYARVRGGRRSVRRNRRLGAFGRHSSAK